MASTAMSSLGRRLASRPSLARAPLQSSRRPASGTPHYNQPSGWLFGEKPLAKGQKRKWDVWEAPYYIGFYGTTALAIVLYMYKPGVPITVWAREEAKKRMEEPTYERT